MDLVARLLGEAWEHRRRRLRLTGVAAVAAIAAAVGVFVAFGGTGDGGGSGGASGRASSPYDSHQAASLLLDRYSKILSHRVSRDSLPANTAASLSRGRIKSRLGLDMTAIGEAEPAPGAKVWLIPGVSGDCLIEQGRPYSASLMCGWIASSDLGPRWIGSDPGRDAGGLVADGIKRITVHLAGGGTLVAPVKDNTYEIRLRKGQRMTSISALVPSGRVISERVGSPSDAGALLAAKRRLLLAAHRRAARATR